MNLLLLRHGIAEDAGPATEYRDEPRRLTEEGIAKMRRAARGMAALGVAPRAILTSPLPRCRQTAEIVGETVGGVISADPRLAPGMELEDLVGAIEDRGHPDPVLVCGHQPGLSIVAGELVGGGVIEFKKGALALLDVASFRPGGAVLRALHPPATLRGLAR